MKDFFKNNKTLNKNKIIFHLTDTYFIKDSKIGEKVDLPGFARIFKVLEFLSKTNVNTNCYV